MNFAETLKQTWDFVVKALKSYAQTPEGQVELQDIIQAWEGDEHPEADNGEVQDVLR